MNRGTEHSRPRGLKTSILFFFSSPISLEIVVITKHSPCCTNLYIHKQQLHTYKHHHSNIFDIYETGTTIRSTSGAHPPSTPATFNVFPVPLFKLKVMLATPVICPLPVGTKAILCVTPLTVMSANRCVVSPFVYLILMVVLVVVEEEIPLKVRVSPAEPPM